MKKLIASAVLAVIALTGVAYAAQPCCPDQPCCDQPADCCND